jgi:hypothetical protein
LGCRRLESGMACGRVNGREQYRAVVGSHDATFFAVVIGDNLWPPQPGIEATGSSGPMACDTPIVGEKKRFGIP